MGDAETGCVVTRINHGMSACGQLEVHDVILEVDGVAVANDLTVPLRDVDRVEFSHLFHMKQVGETARLTILRDGERLESTVTPNNTEFLVPHRTHKEKPSYFIIGGLVFQPLNMEYILLFEEAPADLSNHTFYQNVRSAERRQVIVINKVLADPLNRGYHDWQDMVVKSINGEIARDMTHVAELIDTAAGPWLRILTEDGAMIVLDLELARATTSNILENYGMAEDRSGDLRPVTGMMQ
jgi:hypothetical protein